MGCATRFRYRGLPHLSHQRQLSLLCVVACAAWTGSTSDAAASAADKPAAAGSDWEEVKTDDGRSYYFNAKTGVRPAVSTVCRRRLVVWLCMDVCMSVRVVVCTWVGRLVWLVHATDLRRVRSIAHADFRCRGFNPAPQSDCLWRLFDWSFGPCRVV